MKALFKIIFLLLCVQFVNAQVPIGTPTINSSGWAKYNWLQGRMILDNTDTSFASRFAGTMVYRPNDGKIYYWDSVAKKYQKLSIGSDVPINIATASLTATGDWTQNWNNKQLLFNKIRTLGLFTTNLITGNVYRQANIGTVGNQGFTIESYSYDSLSSIIGQVSKVAVGLQGTSEEGISFQTRNLLGNGAVASIYNNRFVYQIDSDSIYFMPGEQSVIGVNPVNDIHFILGNQPRVIFQSNGFVGINTQPPLEMLDVNGNIQSRDAFIVYNPLSGSLRGELYNGGTYLGLRTITNHPLSIITNSIKRAEFTESGIFNVLTKTNLLDTSTAPVMSDLDSSNRIETTGRTKKLIATSINNLTASSGITRTINDFKLGQDSAQVGSPAALQTTREVPLNGKTIYLSGDSGRVVIGRPFGSAGFDYPLPNDQARFAINDTSSGKKLFSIGRNKNGPINPILYRAQREGASIFFVDSMSNKADFEAGISKVLDVTFEQYQTGAPFYYNNGIGQSANFAGHFQSFYRGRDSLYLDNPGGDLIGALKGRLVFSPNALTNTTNNTAVFKGGTNKADVQSAGVFTFETGSGSYPTKKVKLNGYYSALTTELITRTQDTIENYYNICTGDDFTAAGSHISNFHADLFISGAGAPISKNHYGLYELNRSSPTFNANKLYHDLIISKTSDIPLATLHVDGKGLFTDTLTITTMGIGDSSNRAASTELVKRLIALIPGGGGGSGITSLNGLTGPIQTFATGTSGIDFGISSTGTIHTFNMPDASGSARGVINTGTQTIAGSKTFTSQQLNIYDADLVAQRATSSSAFYGLSLRANTGMERGGIKLNMATGEIKMGGFQGGGYFPTFHVNNTEAGRFATTGFFGIATTSPDRLLHAESSDAITNAITYAQRLSHITSGTAAINFGVGEEYELENASGVNKVASTFESIWTDATNATEDASFNINLIRNGTLTQAASFNSTGGLLLSGLSGSGTRMVVADASGNLSTQSIPSGGGVTTIGAILDPGSLTKSSNGAVISGTSLYMQSADATYPGLINTGTQMLAGRKTFQDGVVAQTTSSSNARLALNGDISGAAEPGVFGLGLSVESYTYTDGGPSRVVSNFQLLNKISNPTLEATNAVTYTTAVNLYVMKPTAGTNITITQNRSLFATGIAHMELTANGISEGSSSSLTMGEKGHYIATGSTATYTLPDRNSYLGVIYYVKNAGSGILTIQRGGSDQIYDISVVTSIAIAPGESRIIIAGSNYWYVE